MATTFPMDRPRRVSSHALASQIGKRDVSVIDVREPMEYASGHIAGSLNIPLPHLEERMGELPEGPLVVHCEGGYRSAIAASVLSRAGKNGVMDMVGGFKAWVASKLPVEQQATSPA